MSGFGQLPTAASVKDLSSRKAFQHIEEFVGVLEAKQSHINVELTSLKQGIKDEFAKAFQGIDGESTTAEIGAAIKSITSTIEGL